MYIDIAEIFEHIGRIGNTYSMHIFFVGYINKKLGKSNKIGFWLVGCLGFNGPFRQYNFSLYRAVSQRGRKKREISESKKCPNNPLLHLLQVQWAIVLLLSKLAGRPGTKNLPSTIATPDYPGKIGNKTEMLQSIRKIQIIFFHFNCTVLFSSFSRISQYALSHMDNTTVCYHSDHFY